MEEVYKKLAGEEASLRIIPLALPDDIPPEERTEDFIAALEQAKASDVEYLTKIEALDSQGRDDEFTLAKLDRELRDVIRARLGLPPRPKKVEINRAERARAVGIDPNPELQAKKSKSSHSDQALQTLKFPDELESVMGKISDGAKLAEQEMGLSTLFLAFGFLEWFDSDTSDNKAFAPLLLLPVKIERQKARGGQVFYLSAREDSAETNLSLQKLLERNFNRSLPEFESDDEENVTSVEDYLERVRSEIKGLARWQVHRWLVLGHFAFGRFAMYADLSPENWSEHPAKQNIVSSILRGSEGSAGDGLLHSIPEDYLIDDPEIEKIAPFLIQDADASQHSALVDVMTKKNLVIQGPPGTGKSQTITNIIANAIASEKKVLFLAEKQAALEVVKRRLNRSGLGEFCLELHSDKSSPKQVIESLKERVDVSSEGSTRANQSPDSAWHENRKQIGAYVDALHAEREDGLTPFRLIWRAVHGRSTNADVIDTFKSTSLSDTLLSDAQKRQSVENELAIFASVSAFFCRTYGHPAVSPWAQTTLGDIAGHQIASLIETLNEIRVVGDEIANFVSTLPQLGIVTIKDVILLVDAESALGDPSASELIPEIPSLDLDELEKTLTYVGEWHRLSRALAQRPDLSQQNFAKLAIAAEVARTGLANGLAEMTPAEACKFARTTIERNTIILDLIRRFKSILPIFEFDHSIVGGKLIPVGVAVQAGAKVMPEHRSWVNSHRDIDQSEFWILENRRRGIATIEAEWRSILASYGQQPWPDPLELESAAAILHKSGVKKAIASLSGAVKTAREFAGQIGFKASDDMADALDSFANHVRELRAFEMDEAAARLLGASWKGFSTPFIEIGAGIRLRELFLTRIGRLQHGADVAHRLVALPIGAEH